MRVNKKWLVMLVLVAAIPLSGCGFITKLRARDALNKGVKAFVDQKYDDAAKMFEESIRLDPQFNIAKSYLASTYASQFVPGSPEENSKQMAHKAIDIFANIIESEPNNTNAMLSIASLYYQLQEFDKSKEWCGKIQIIDPKNAEALYRVAVMDYDDSVKKTGLQGENVEFLTAEEKDHTLKDIDEGLAVIDNALKIRPEYFDAMDYQNLLWREKAKFEKDRTKKAEITRQADLVAQKALGMRLKAQEEEAKKPKKLAAPGK
jgi:tetratricopeptide (TPR) repeat protein